MVSFFIKTLLATIFFVFTASNLNAEKAFDSPLSSPLENNKSGELNTIDGDNDVLKAGQKKPAPKRPFGKKKPAGKKTTKKRKPGPKKPVTKGGPKTTATTGESGATDATTEAGTTTTAST
uniref:Secreted protein n=1 Tax=Strongyloides papillosus TaxID=174720 RepID=A0A0N5BGJ3_STREA